MQIRLVVLTITAPLVVLLYSLRPILIHGALVSNLLFLVLAST
jgi:hypothetical protein